MVKADLVNRVLDVARAMFKRESMSGLVDYTDDTSEPSWRTLGLDIQEKLNQPAVFIELWADRANIHGEAEPDPGK